MRIDIKVTPRSSRQKIVCEDGAYRVYVHESATDGKANKAVFELLAKFFKVPKSSMRILRGEKNRNKTIEIMNFEGER